MKYSIFLSIFNYKPWLINEGGLNIRLDYPVNFVSNKYKPRSNISCVASGRGLTVLFFLWIWMEFSCKHPK